MEGEAIIGFLLMGALIIGVFVVMLNQQQKLDDQNNTEVVYLDQLPQVCGLAEPGKFRVRIFRQSGHLQKDDQFFTSIGDAIKVAPTTTIVVSRRERRWVKPRSGECRDSG